MAQDPEGRAQQEVRLSKAIKWDNFGVSNFKKKCGGNLVTERREYYNKSDQKQAQIKIIYNSFNNDPYNS